MHIEKQTQEENHKDIIASSRNIIDTSTRVTGTEGGPENASATAANPDATPQPSAIPTDAGGKNRSETIWHFTNASAGTNVATEFRQCSLI